MSLPSGQPRREALPLRKLPSLEGLKNTSFYFSFGFYLFLSNFIDFHIFRKINCFFPIFE